MSYDHEAEHLDINNRQRLNRQRLLDLAVEYHKLADRIDKIENHFDAGGLIEQLAEGLYAMSAKVEALAKLIEQRGTHE